MSCFEGRWLFGGVVVADEVGSEEIKGKREPEKPFIVFVKAVFFLVVMKPAMFVKELHLHIVPPAIWGCFVQSHFI